MTVRVLELPEWAVWAFLAIVVCSLVARTVLSIVETRLKNAERSVVMLDLADRWEEALRRKFGRRNQV